MKRATKIVLGVVGVLAAMQLVRCNHSNPPVTGEIVAPDAVKAVLRRSCGDCHSNETVWPWYSQVAPVSWLVYRDVVQGRKRLNFSEWASLPPERRTKKLRSSLREVKKGEMPLWFYLPLHRQARVSDQDKALLEAWIVLTTGPVPLEEKDDD